MERLADISFFDSLGATEGCVFNDVNKARLGASRETRLSRKYQKLIKFFKGIGYTATAAAALASGIIGTPYSLQNVPPDMPYGRELSEWGSKGVDALKEYGQPVVDVLRKYAPLYSQDKMDEADARYSGALNRYGNSEVALGEAKDEILQLNKQLAQVNQSLKEAYQTYRAMLADNTATSSRERAQLEDTITQLKASKKRLSDVARSRAEAYADLKDSFIRQGRNANDAYDELDTQLDALQGRYDDSMTQIAEMGEGNRRLQDSLGRSTHEINTLKGQLASTQDQLDKARTRGDNYKQNYEYLLSEYSPKDNPLRALSEADYKGAYGDKINSTKDTLHDLLSKGKSIASRGAKAAKSAGSSVVDKAKRGVDEFMNNPARWTPHY